MDDSQTRQMPVKAWVPAQRPEGGQAVAPPSVPVPVPSWATAEETMLLPAFVTASKVAEEVEHPPTPPANRDDDRLPSSERNMLIFVSLILAVGTLAIVAMASVGR